MASLLEVGTGFHPELTGRENIYLNGTILGMRKNEIDRKFDEIVDFSEIEKFLDTPVKRYSSGMYVRLAFAVAAYLEPEILLVDEVLAVGDAPFQNKCLGKMGNVAKEGRTMLFVSHNMAAVSNLCPRSVYLSQGSILQDGPTEDVISRYLSQISETTNTSLAARTDRQGAGNIRFNDTWIEDEKGNRLSSAASGRQLKIVASYEIKDNMQIQNLKVAIAIFTLSNIAVTDLSNVTTGDLFLNDIPPRGVFECLIPKLPLNAGTYIYNVFAMTGSGIQDSIQHAGTFTVEPGDYFGSGNIPDRSRLFFIDHKWSIHKIS